MNAIKKKDPLSFKEENQSAIKVYDVFDYIFIYLLLTYLYIFIIIISYVYIFIYLNIHIHIVEEKNLLM